MADFVRLAQRQVQSILSFSGVCLAHRGEGLLTLYRPGSCESRCFEENGFVTFVGQKREELGREKHIKRNVRE